MTRNLVLALTEWTLLLDNTSQQCCDKSWFRTSGQGSLKSLLLLGDPLCC